MSPDAANESRIRSNTFEQVLSLLRFDLSHIPLHCTQPEEHPRGQVSLPLDHGSPTPRAPYGGFRLVGFDETGRGSLAGPVTVACVSFRLESLSSDTEDLRQSVLQAYVHLNDSKRVTKRRREVLHDLIVADADWGIGYASAIEIDCEGIVSACRNAARRAYRDLGIVGDLVLFDRGLSLGESKEPSLTPSSVQITKGDAKSFHIAAASILAKVRRDALMCELDTRTAMYGFASHKGYGSAAHFSAIAQHGPSRFHRRTFLTDLLSPKT